MILFGQVKLTGRQRAIFESLAKGFGLAKIAAIMDSSEPAIWQSMYRAREANSANNYQIIAAVAVELYRSKERPR